MVPSVEIDRVVFGQSLVAMRMQGKQTAEGMEPE